MDPYLYKRKADLIIYHIQTNEQIHLSDKSRHDIHSNMYQAVMAENELAISGKEYWKEEYHDLKKQEFPMKWNELRITLAQHIGKPVTAEIVLDWMLKRDMGERTR